MTSMIIKSTFNHIAAIAERYSNQMRPFFFVKNNEKKKFYQQILTLKVNCQMTPFLENLPKQIRLGLWNLSSLTNIKKTTQQLPNSLILNPFKSQQLITQAFTTGISKMIVQDIQQITKIQQCYFNLRKYHSGIKSPQYIWTVENVYEDFENVCNLIKCQLEFSGLFFKKQVCLDDMEKFIQHQVFKNRKLYNFRETTIENLSNQSVQLKKYGIEPLITNYSQTNNYLMVCRILGRDRQGQPVLQQSTLDFLYKPDTCSCHQPQLRLDNIFQAGGYQWLIIKPTRLDKLQSEHIAQ